jgi:hypothetical protein
LHRGLRPWADAAWCLLTPILCRSRSPFAVTCHHRHHRHRCHRPRRLPSASSSSFTVAATLRRRLSLPPNQHQRPETTNDSPLAPHHRLPRSHRCHHRHIAPSRHDSQGGSRTSSSLTVAALRAATPRCFLHDKSCTRTVRLAWSFVYIVWKFTVLLSSHPIKVSARQGIGPSSLCRLVA